MVILFRRGSGRHMQVGCPLQWVTSQTGCVPSPTVGSTCIPENCLCVLGPATHVARMGPSGPVRWPSSTKCCPLYPNDRKGVGLMGWGSGRKFIMSIDIGKQRRSPGLDPVPHKSSTLFPAQLAWSYQPPGRSRWRCIAHTAGARAAAASAGADGGWNSDTGREFRHGKRRAQPMNSNCKRYDDA